MKALKLPSRDALNEILDYDSSTGTFRWKRRSVKWFLEGHNPVSYCQRWNKRFAGKVAGNINAHGYRRIVINGRGYYAHRLAWKITYGEEPKYIDHIDGQFSNNCILNLRSVIRRENQRNQPTRSNNTSGVVGVSWAGDRRKWHAYILAGDNRETLGYFKNKKDAITARKAAEVKYGFHENHGRKAVAR